MTISLDHLLPDADQSIRCAEHARTIAVDPGGTAIRADRVILVATPGPWPKPALGHPLLAGLAEVLASNPVPTRLLAASGAPFAGWADGLGEVPVVVFERRGEGATERRFVVDGPGELVLWGRALVAGDDVSGWAVPTADTGVLGDHPAAAAVLICTQGSHDVCCGSEGERFASSAEAAGFDVYRVSHTGGHRFAPTALTMPDGRMWADLDIPTLTAIVNRTGDAADVLNRCRGWWGADTGPAQVAERAILAEIGWLLDETERTVTVIPGLSAGDDEPIAVSVQAGADTWDVHLRQGRTVPTIKCRAPGGLPAKAAREYVVERVIRR